MDFFLLNSEERVAAEVHECGCMMGWMMMIGLAALSGAEGKLSCDNFVSLMHQQVLNALNI